MGSSILSYRRLSLSAVLLLVAMQVSAPAQIGFGPVRAYDGAAGRLVSADLDGDTDIDLVSDDAGGTRVSILRNNGDGTFAPPVELSIPAGTRSVVAADLNGDTHIDLIFARAGPFPTGDGIITVLLNDGFGNFGSTIDYAVIVSNVVGQQLTPLSLAAGDLDGDGDVDLAAATVLLNDVNQSGFFSIISNQGNDAFARPILASSIQVDASQSFSRDIVASDFDNDADLDLAVASSLSNAVNSVSVILNHGDGTFGAVRNERLGGGGTTALSLIVGEINGDGFIDLITINGAHTYTVLLNLLGGTNPLNVGQFKDQGQLPLGSQALPATDIPSGGAALRDLDGDGNRELVAGLAGDSGPGSLAVFTNLGTGLFGSEMTIGPCFDYGEVIAEDLDGDGDVDVAAADPTGQRILVLLNELVPAVPPIGDPADADGDGVPDCADGCPFDPTKSQPGVCGCAGSFIVAPCDDGLFCTVTDACSAGVCGGVTRDCSASGDPCNTGVCNEATNLCEAQPFTDGTVCDDGVACTDSVCTSAVCTRTAHTGQITLSLNVDALSNATTRDVTCVITTCGGGTDTRVVAVPYTAAGMATVVLANVDAAASWVGVSDGHTLRRRAALGFVSCAAAVDLTGANRLHSGDFQTSVIPQDNLVDITDFSILASHFDMPVVANSRFGADATGDGIEGMGDFAVIQANFMMLGDATHACPPAVGRSGGDGVTPFALRDRALSTSPRSGRTTVYVGELALEGAARADLDGDGVIDAADMQAFSERHGLELLPAFKRQLASLIRIKKSGAARPRR